MRILFASAELAPVVSVGGLGSAASGLVRALRVLKHDVEVVLPDYEHYELTEETTTSLDSPLWTGPLKVRSGHHPIVGALTLVQSPSITRPHPYLDEHGNGWSDNDQRFLSFSYAVAALAARSRPDIIHVNDWHTAAALAMIDPDLACATVLSIHNLAYQGTCDAGWLEHLGPRAQSAARDSACNPLAAGIALADAIVVVSPTYRAEILEEHNACGLHDVLTSRQDSIYGIRNGIETDVWNPATDPHIDVNFDSSSLSNKLVLQHALRDELRLAHPPEDARTSLSVVVSRLVHQKGIDQLLQLLPFLGSLPTQVVVLGSGDHQLADSLRTAADDDPNNIAFVDGFVEPLGHRILAAGDFVLMPSRFEPCGLTQMQAMRYGTIPIVAGVGGLLDTVSDADLNSKSGTGFVADNHRAVSMLDAWHRAQRAWQSAQRRRGIQRRGMRADWSWAIPAQQHVNLYEHLATTGTALPAAHP